MAIEQNLSQLIRREKYLEYIAKRPRAQRFGAHGLFTGDKDSLVLSQTAKAVAEHPGNVWLPIISLRREDAARLGYDNAENWKSFLSSYAMQMATAMKIPWEQFRWYAAFHNESHHPHIHMVCYSADPAKGFLTKTGIAQIKSGLAKHIFRQELTELYQKQTKSRNALNEDARSVLEQLIEQMRSGTAVNHRMEKLMEHLAERLRHTGGKKQYGYLKAPLKAVVDEIVDELAKDPCVAAAYALWHELREDVLRTYRDDLPPRLPLSQQKEFKRIKNIVIEEAVKLGARQQVFHPDDQQDGVSAATPGDPSLPELTQPDDDCGDPVESPPEAPPEKSGSAKAHMEWSKEYRLVRRCLFGDKNQPQDFEQAFSLFQEEAQKGNALAMCDLGRMLADGLGQEIDIQAAHVWYRKALAAFHAVEEQKKNRYAEYRIGKLYAAGLGCEQDYFEKENVNTLFMDNEMILTFMMSQAQAESESLSGNVRWGHQKNFKDGKVYYHCKTFLGYRWGADGQPEIDPEQAAIVRRIFSRFLLGHSVRQITTDLMADGIKTATGKTVWHDSVVQKMLCNEKYIGDALLQKTYIADLFTREKRVNNGELPKYYVHDCHPAIIDRKTFQKVQEELARRSSLKKTSSKAKTQLGKYCGKYVLSELLVCGECGSPYRRVIWTQKGVKRVVWRCQNRLEHGRKICKQSPTLDEGDIHDAVISAMNELFRIQAAKDAVKAGIAAVLAGEEQTMSLPAVELQIRNLQERQLELFQLIVSAGADCTDYDEELQQVNMAKTRLMAQKAELEKEQRGAAAFESRLEELDMALEQASGALTDFDELTVRQLVSNIKVLDKDSLLICFKDGTEITQAMQRRQTA